MRRKILSGVAAASTLAFIPAAQAQQQPSATSPVPQVDPALKPFLESPIRKDDAVRDKYRHPAETLTFFRIKPGMSVVDYMPAGGWYSRILIPYLGPKGTYIALNPKLSPELTGYWDSYRGTAQKFPAQAREWVGEGGAKVIGANTDDVPANLDGTVDRFLIFREIHNMRRSGWLHDTLLTARKLLKDDGLIGVVQHRAKADAPFSYTDGSKGYQREEDVVAMFKLYGFQLVGASEINANPADPANWEDGVWTLPPGYRGAPEGSPKRAELDKIGESDRMTLLFRKLP